MWRIGSDRHWPSRVRTESLGERGLDVSGASKERWSRVQAENGAATVTTSISLGRVDSQVVLSWQMATTCQPRRAVKSTDASRSDRPSAWSSPAPQVQEADLTPAIDHPQLRSVLGLGLGHGDCRVLGVVLSRHEAESAQNPKFFPRHSAYRGSTRLFLKW